MTQPSVSETAPQVQADLLSLLQRDRSYVLTLAGNPGTAPETLAQLSALDDSAVGNTVAMNPNTPWQTLQRLLDQYPRAFLANPVIPLLLLEQPYLLHSLPEITLLRLLAQEAMPALLCMSLSSHPAALVRETAALHIQMHGPAESSWHEAVMALMSQRNLAVSTVDERLLGIVYDAPLVAPWLIAMLARHNNYRVRVVVAMSAGIAVADQERLALDEAVLVCAELARNPHVSQQILSALASSSECLVRAHLAGNPSTPPAILADLAHGAEEEVVDELARNPHIPQTLWDEYAAATHPSLHLPLAANPLTPDDLLEQFARDDDRVVRMAVASNPRLTAATAEKLAGDRYVDVRRGAAENPQTSATMLRRMINYHQYDMRRAVAANPNAPGDLLASIATRVKKDEIIVTLVANPNTPQAVLQRLVKAYPQSALAAIVHPQMPVSLRREWATYIMGALAARPRHNVSLMVRFLALSSPLLAPETLAEHAQQEDDWLLRFVIAQNHVTPPATLEHLTHDGNSYVRAAAQQQIYQSQR